MLAFRRASLATKSLCDSYRMASSSSKQDVYVAVSDAQLASSAAADAVSADISQLWKQSNAKDKDTRTFYGLDGKTVVAVGVGKKSANKDENALKEQTRRAVRLCLGSSEIRNCRLTTEVCAHRLPLLPTLSRPPTPSRSRSTLCTLRTPLRSEPRSPTSSGTSRRPRTPRPSSKRSRSPRSAMASRPRSNRTRLRMVASDSTGRPVACTDRLRCVPIVSEYAKLLRPRGKHRSALLEPACRTLRAFSWRRRQTSARRRCELSFFFSCSMSRNVRSRTFVAVQLLRGRQEAV